MAFGSGSLVSNILQKSSGLDERILEENIQRLSKKSIQIKGEIYELVKQNYVEFQSYVDSTGNLEQRLREVTSEYGRLTGKIEQDLRGRIAQSSDKRLEVEAKLCEIQQRIDSLRNLVSVYHAVEASKANLQSEQFSVAASELGGAAQEMDKLAGLGCDAKVFLALQSELSLATSNLALRLHEEWSRFVSWSPKVFTDNPKMAALLKVELRISTRSGLDAAVFDEVISAMKMLSTVGVWGQKVEGFGKKLLTMVVCPLVTHSQLRAVLVQEKAATVLRLAHSKTDAAIGPQSAVANLYDSLSVVFDVVKLAVPDKYQQEWMAGVGSVVCPEMTDLIIKHGLSASIPKSSAELQAYDEVSTMTAKFEARLVDVGVVKVDFDQLTQYTQNVNTHFAAQKCRDLLVRARNILKKPLHDTVSVQHDVALENLSCLTLASADDKKVPKLNEVPDPLPQFEAKDLVALTFVFPVCSISLSIQEYMELIIDTLRECCVSPSSSAVQLFYSVRNMVELYCAVVPSHHRLVMTELPRVAAIVHNNCMYLAHNLLLLGHQFRAHLPPPLNSQVATFVDQVTVVRQLGEECFLAEMRKQSGVVLECLKVLANLDNVSSEPKHTLVLKGIQQALLHVKQLGKVYAEILPTEVHLKAIGALLNILATNVITRILALEDIAVEDAVELCGIVDRVLDSKAACVSPSIETGGRGTEQLDLYCANWSKLKELGFILHASLLEIVDRWGMGVGPLTQQFSPAELRGLVKALFQNTERRAAALSKIRL